MSQISNGRLLTPLNYDALAEQFMLNAVGARKGQNIWIQYMGERSSQLRDACKAVVERVGATPHMVDTGSAALNELYAKGQLAGHFNRMESRMRQMHGYVRITDDADELLIPSARLAEYGAGLKSMTDYRVKHTNWLVVAAPTPEFAQSLGMPDQEFSSFYERVCLVNYAAMTEAAEPLVQAMTSADHVVITGKNTCLTARKAGIPAAKATGLRNIPDGECYTALTRDSVNGHILFGPSVYLGEAFNSIRLEFEAGRAVNAVADTRERTQKLNAILDRDEGARYVGEFALAFNPQITRPTGNILFDEKIAGSLHLAMGNAYSHTDNGNRSSIHWDMVKIQTPEHGGGEVIFDGTVIRRDGQFIPTALQRLNPERMLKL